MASDKIIRPIIYADYSVTLTTTSGRTVAVASSKSGYRTISANFITSDSLYYLCVTDGVQPLLSINSSGDVQLMGMNKGLAAPNRTISVRCGYVPI